MFGPQNIRCIANQLPGNFSGENLSGIHRVPGAQVPVLNRTVGIDTGMGECGKQHRIRRFTQGGNDGSATAGNVSAPGKGSVDEQNIAVTLRNYAVPDNAGFVSSTKMNSSIAALRTMNDQMEKFLKKKYNL